MKNKIKVNKKEKLSWGPSIWWNTFNGLRPKLSKKDGKFISLFSLKSPTDKSFLFIATIPTKVWYKMFTVP